ncbi:hypothetical protein SAMN06265365_13641 [Tistlia consotensis]|uniref:Uncharacterized protein n=1 Tax=Tistlia consotensis USBA 355 TaxID=560819 RepID=A0A1Y6CTM5_9PROT|nr:hypothetical protein [Tistlia consotensis]SMF78430.1 hypothetical protein SAMN05428998_13842 [Tistlia consotensis USBA 355]SNS18492.1 hypothetical protein SAMN06265365_13641 [Tistlia consotensis]
MPRTVLRRLTLCLLPLAAAALFAGRARAGENEAIALHVVPGQYVQMTYGSRPVQVLEMLAVIRDHGTEPIRIVSTRCEAIGAESRSRLAQALGLQAHTCSLDQTLPWELHPGRSRRIGFSWPVATPRPPGREKARRTQPGVENLRIAGLEVLRASEHGRTGDLVRIVLTLEDGSQARSEGFLVEPFVHKARNLHEHYLFGGTQPSRAAR